MLSCLAAAVALIGMTISSSGCRLDQAPADELLIASPHRDEIREEIERAFRKWYRQAQGREVRPIWLDLGGSSNIQKYIVDRLSRGPSAGVDVFFGGGSDPFESLKRLGYLVPFKLADETLAKLPTDLHGVPIYDSEYYWYGVVLSSFGILYNAEVLRRLDMPVPTSWADLGSPAFVKNGTCWIATADPRQSSSVHVIYENILQAYGWEAGYATLIQSAANAREFVRESAAVPRQVQIGEVAAAPVIDFYAFSLIAREGRENIGFVLPEGQTVITPDAVAIVRGARNQTVAESFLTFLMSDEGQRIWMLRRGQPGGPERYDLGRPSVLPHLYTDRPRDMAVTVNPFETASSLRYDGRVASRRWNVLNDLIGATLIDCHVELQSAWLALLEVGDNADLVAELVRPPCSDAELNELAEPMRQSPRVRTETIAQWSIAARARYRAVTESAQRRVSP